MDELESRMRATLLQLAMTSNGRTACLDASGGGEPDYVLVDDNGRAKLARGDAPQLAFAARWDAAGADQHAREQLLEQAESTLAHIRKSQGDRATVEPKDARDRRIVRDGEGFSARDVAIAMRCGVTDVRKAREATGRDIEFGELAYDGPVLTLTERTAEVRRLTHKGLSTRAIATRLHIGHQSVRCALARAPK